MPGCIRTRVVASDFLCRLQYLIPQSIENLQTDNGSEFAHYLEEAALYFSRVRTPKDNPKVKRFHETLEYEWPYDGNLILDCDRFNRQLTEWLIEYNFNRPHEALDCSSPIEYIEKELIRIRGPSQVIPMWSASIQTRI